MIKVLVCGGRDFLDYDYLEDSLDNILHEYEQAGNKTTIISGCARGADSLAIKYADVTGAAVEKYPADWDKYGKSAGYIRNKQMLDEAKPDLVVAFPGGRGTQNMIDISKAANVKVIEIDPQPE